MERDGLGFGEVGDAAELVGVLASTYVEEVMGLLVERIPDASHWVQNDAPDRVNELLIEYLLT